MPPIVIHDWVLLLVWKDRKIPFKKPLIESGLLFGVLSFRWMDSCFQIFRSNRLFYCIPIRLSLLAKSFFAFLTQVTSSPKYKYGLHLLTCLKGIEIIQSIVPEHKEML